MNAEVKKHTRVIICHRSWKGELAPQHGIFVLKKARKNYKCTYPDCDNEIKKGDLYFAEITPKSAFPPRYCVTCGNDNKKFAGLQELQEKCAFCKTTMILAWKGLTITGNPLSAYICPKCYSTRYIGVPTDPTYQMIREIQQAFMKIWKHKTTK